MILYDIFRPKEDYSEWSDLIRSAGSAIRLVPRTSLISQGITTAHRILWAKQVDSCLIKAIATDNFQTI